MDPLATLLATALWLHADDVAFDHSALVDLQLRTSALERAADRGGEEFDCVWSSLQFASIALVEATEPGTGASLAPYLQLLEDAAAECERQFLTLPWRECSME